MSVETSTAPNLYQLGLEIGGNPSFRMVGPDDKGLFRVSSSVDDKALERALAAHVADPEIQPPDEPDIDPEHASDDPLAAEVARLSSLLEAVLADPEIAKVADIEAIRTAAEGSKDDDALVLAVAKAIGADPAEVRKKRDADPQWFADVVAKYGLGGSKGDEAAVVKG